METSTDYLKNVSYLKQLRQTTDRQSMQAAYADDFEQIYKKAMESDIKLNKAKNFIGGLNEQELQTLQKYTGLANAIDAGALTPEGAYNLLMHDYEKYDFNGDGAVQDGIGNMAPIIPAGMEESIKEAYVKSLNSVDDKDRLMAMTITFDMGRLNSTINNTPYKAEKIDYEYLSDRVKNILNPTPPAYSSQELKRSIAAFWEKFELEYINGKNV